MNSAIHTRRVPSRMRGVGLVEILVTLLVMTIGLLGIAGLQLVSLRDTYASSVRTQATAAANFILDRMRANRPAVTATGSDYAVGTSFTTYATVDNQAKADINQWKTLLTNTINGSPVGTVAITGTAASATDPMRVTVTITWNERETSAAGAVSDTAGLTFTTITEI